MLERAGVALNPVTGEPDSADAKWPSFSLRKRADALSEDARSLLIEAAAEAKQAGRRSAEPEDILLALAGKPDSPGARILLELGADQQAILSKLEGGGPERHSHASPAAAEERAPGEERLAEHEAHDTPIELSPAGHRVLRLARTEADVLSHGSVDTAHLLLGLVVAGDGLAWQVLKESGIEIEGARTAVVKAMS